MTAKVFGGGEPTEAQVSLLEKRFAGVKPGEEVAYADIATAIGEAVMSTRWNSVLEAWRDQIRDRHGLETERRAPVLRILTAEDALDAAKKRLGLGGRVIANAGERTQAIDPRELPEHKRAAHTALSSALDRIGAVMAAATKQIRPVFRKVSALPPKI